MRPWEVGCWDRDAESNQAPGPRSCLVTSAKAIPAMVFRFDFGRTLGAGKPPNSFGVVEELLQEQQNIQPDTTHDLKPGLEKVFR